MPSLSALSPPSVVASLCGPYMVTFIEYYPIRITRSLTDRAHRSPVLLSLSLRSHSITHTASTRPSTPTQSLLARPVTLKIE